MTAPFVISGVFLLLAAGCAQGIFHWLRKARTMSRWPTVAGRISSTWSVLDGERMRYDYEVAGRHYVGRRISWRVGGGTSTAEPTPQELAEKYPPGSNVAVYYDPQHPSTAVLEPRNMRNAATAIVFTCAFGFFGLVFLGLGLR
jgi:hypothetical protein